MFLLKGYKCDEGLGAMLGFQRQNWGKEGLSGAKFFHKSFLKA